jgi:hypothetical protein
LEHPRRNPIRLKSNRTPRANERNIKKVTLQKVITTDIRGLAGRKKAILLASTTNTSNEEEEENERKGDQLKIFVDVIQSCVDQSATEESGRPKAKLHR